MKRATVILTTAVVIAFVAVLAFSWHTECAMAYPLKEAA